VAETRDEAGDSTTGRAAHDLLGAGIGFDRKTGHMVAVIRLRGEPNAFNRAFMSVYAGFWTPNGCSGFPLAGFGSYTDSFNATWFRQDTAESAKHGGAGKVGDREKIQKLWIKERRLAGRKWNCLNAALTDPDDPSVIYDQIKSVSIKGQPELMLKMPRVRRAIPPNQVRKLRIVIRNPGDGPLRNLRLRFPRVRGLKVAPRALRVKSIRPHTRRAVTVRVRLSRAAGAKTTLRVLARSGKLKAPGRVTLRPSCRKGRRQMEVGEITVAVSACSTSRIFPARRAARLASSPVDPVRAASTGHEGWLAQNSDPVIIRSRLSPACWKR
jgi:hypothetical protein